MTIRLDEAGLASLIVDCGRPRSRNLGVPVGGAADRSALALGNAILGNAPDAAALEITLVGPTLTAVDQVAVVLAGAPFALHADQRSLRVNHSFTLEPGEILRIGGTPRGARAYLCVAGGFQTEVILDSRSSLTPLPAGTELVCAQSARRPSFVRPDVSTHVITALAPGLGSGRHKLRVVPGPQADWFPSSPGESHWYTVSPASDRMGLRLTGPTLQVPPRELVSEAVAPGAIQITRDGQPIVLGIDGQTIGGYPKIAQVIAADLDLVGQLRPGDQVAFDMIPLEQAENAFRWRTRRLDNLCQRIRLAAQAI
jgi:biotin-dependent carboxylase-like uncharacterized protein